MIEFKVCSWKNFLSTGNVKTEVRLDQHPNTLITGENGAGKSTILDVLCFALYGKPFRKIKKNQLINSVNNGSTVVEIEFRTNGKDYRVVRGIKPAVFDIYENDNIKNQSAAARDQQEDLEKNILRMNMKSFTQMVILGSSSFVPFMQLTPYIRREVIEDLLDISVFSTMSLLLKEKVNKNKQDTLLNSKDIDNIDAMIAMQKEQSKYDNERKKEEISRCEDRISDIDKAVNRLRSELENDQSAIDELIDQIVDEGKNHARASRALKIERDLEAKKKNSQKTIDFYNNNDHCPTCTQEIDNAIKAEKIEEKNKVISDLNDAMNKISEEIEKINTRSEEIAEIKKQIEIRRKQSEDKNVLIQQDERERSLLQKDILKLKEESITQSANKLRELNEERETAIESKKELLDQNHLLEMASLILRDSGIKSKIIKQYIPIINQLVNKYLAAMDFFVKFELDENFNEKILSRHRDDFSYDSFSEGEKMRIDLALLFTWRTIAKMKNSSSTNLLILDEVFDASLDANGCDEFLKIVQNLEDSNVFVISHKGDIMQDKFVNHIRFEKYKNFSRIAA